MATATITIEDTKDGQIHVCVSFEPKFEHTPAHVAAVRAMEAIARDKPEEPV